jgi:hypothetical protein
MAVAVTEISIPFDRNSSPEGSEALVQRLDELLERYLNLLDKYQRMREENSKNLSAVRSIIS